MDQPLSITQLTFAIKKELETSFSKVFVRGEISNLKEQSSGHLYFTLKDQESQISAVLFKGSARLLSKLPKMGDEVIVRGELSVYPPRGNYQIIVRELEFAGLGDLLLKLHERKAKLQALGYFDPKYKKKLPKIPKRIGVVTSPTGSVIQDIIHILSRRFSGFQLILNPVKVQGEGSALEIAKAIGECNQHNIADVLIVGRGGGSLEDLWAFNEEIVAQAIFESKIPIISAVGHETDYSISDLVADIRAPTPSAAAELVIQEKSQLLDQVFQSKKQISRALISTISQARERLLRVKKHPLFISSDFLLRNFYQKIDLFPEKISTLLWQTLKQKKLVISSLAKQVDGLKPSSQLKNHHEKLLNLQKNIDQALSKEIRQKKEKLNVPLLQKKISYLADEIIREKKQSFLKLLSHLQSIDPKNLLTKGYCILFSEKADSAILSINQLKPKQSLRVLMHDGTVQTTIEEIYVRKP